MKIKFARCEDGKFVKYEFLDEYELYAWIDEQLKKYREMNAISDQNKDSAYLAYKSQFEKFINLEG